MTQSKRKAHLARARQILCAQRIRLAATNHDSLSDPSTNLHANNGPTGTEEPLRDVDCLEEVEELQQNTNDSESSPGEASSDDSSGDESNSDESSSDESSSDESDLESIASDTESVEALDPKVSSTVPVLEWREGAGQFLKRPYGSGSESTRKRQRRHERELKRAASQTYNIIDLFRRQQDLGISVRSARDTGNLNPDSRLRQGAQPEERDCALNDLVHLLKSKPAQIKKYGHILYPESDFDRRHRMVRSFLYRQKEKDRSCGSSSERRREMATSVAKDYNRQGYTGRKIVKWEREWVQKRKIPESKAGKHKKSRSWLDDEATLCAIRDFTKTQGDGRYNQLIRFSLRNPMI